MGRIRSHTCLSNLGLDASGISDILGAKFSIVAIFRKII